MKSTKECPAQVELAEFMDGQLIGPDLEVIAEHLEHCAVCQEAVMTLAPGDTLVESLRGEATAAEKLSSAVPRSLLEKLNRIPRLESSSEKSSAISEDRKPDAGIYEVAQSVLFGERGKERSLGHYRLLEVLGTGGMGEVFRAEDTKLNRTVALKVMLRRIAADPTSKERFLREARAAAGLVSDHIVTVYQVGEDDGIPFVATELLLGKSLEAALREGRKFSIAEILKIGREVAEGLSVAHTNGIVHRDIKSANLWLEQSNKKPFRVKILDFGLARAELDDSQLTHASAIIGTPAFMAPEQARGGKAIDFRSDLFSLGCVLYLLCSHELPFKAETTIETLMAIMLHTPKSPELIQPETPLAIANLVMELLEKDPKNRPSSAEDIIARLDDIESQMSKSESTQRKQSTEAFAKIEPAIKAIGAGTKRPIAIALALFGLAASCASFSILFWQTPDGRIVRIECNDPAIQIAFGNSEMKITGAYAQPIILKPGKVELKIKKLDENGGEFIFETDKLIVTKGDEIALRVELLDSEIKLKHIGKGVIDSKQLPNKLLDGKELTSDQRAALWVLSLGGSVEVNDDGNGINFEEELPKGNYKVTSVNLATNGQVTDSGLANLSELTELNFLDLDSTKISDAGLERLKDLRRMKVLNLWGTKVTDAGILKLKNMTELTRIGLGGRLQITDSSLVQLRRFQELKKLYLDGTQISNAGLPLLRKIGVLELIDLNATQVSDEGLDSVMYIESLTELHLGGTMLSDLTMIRLGELQKLQVLNLSETSLTDLGLDRLHKLTDLRIFYLKETKVTQEGIQRFHAAVPKCTLHCDSGIIQGADAQ